MIPLKDDNPRSVFPVLTVTLMAVNILAFLLELQFGFGYVIMKYGAIPIEIVNGQDLETMFTSMFLHAKVTGTLEPGSQGFCIHMTSLAPALARWLEIQRTASTQ